MPDTPLYATARYRLLKARETMERAKESRVASMVTLADGSKVYQETPPGVGWVLEMKGHPKRYWRTKELAILCWEEVLYGR